MTTEQFDSLKTGLASGLIDEKMAQQIISKHEVTDIERATKSAKSHTKQIYSDLGLPQPKPGPARTYTASGGLLDHLKGTQKKQQEHGFGEGFPRAPRYTLHDILL